MALFEVPMAEAGSKARTNILPAADRATFIFPTDLFIDFDIIELLRQALI